MKEAPLYVQTHDLARWLLQNLAPSGPLEARVHEGALSLLDHVVLALKGFDRERNVDGADAATALLRTQLRLARDLDHIDDRQLLFLTRELDSIGRQIGGWLRRLESDSLQRRHR